MNAGFETILNKAGEKIENKLQLVEHSRKGLDLGEFARILEFTGLDMREIAHVLPISERQLKRYEGKQVLRPDVSDHLLQIFQLYRHGYDVFGKREKFQKWMQRSIVALGGQKPIDLLDTSLGIQLLHDELGRIEYGVLS